MTKSRDMRLRIVAPRAIKPPAAYRAATRQYSAQVRLTANGSMLENYVAGVPFPHIDPNDPQAALKIMWNFTHNFAATDDLDIRNVAVDTGPWGTKGMMVERHFMINHIRRLSYTGRLYGSDPEQLRRTEDALVMAKAGGKIGDADAGAPGPEPRCGPPAQMNPSKLEKTMTLTIPGIG